MARRAENRKNLARHIAVGVNVNLISVGLLAAGGFLSGTSRVVAWLSAVLIWAVLAIVIKFIIKPRWKAIKHIGYYFLPTMPIFWALNEHRARILLQERLEKILTLRPDVCIIDKIIGNAEQRSEGLSMVLDQMDSMKKHRLAEIVDVIRHCARDICGDNSNYNLFRDITSKLPSLKPNRYMQTWDSFLALLSDIFDLREGHSFGEQVRKDMIVPLKDAIYRVDKAHLPAVGGMIEKIMTRQDNEDNLAREIMEMIPVLQGQKRQEVRQRIFDQSKNRAFDYPKQFGLHFLRVLNQLKHKVFWLDIQSLRSVLAAPENYSDSGLIPSNKSTYEQLCSKVFAQLENPRHTGIHHGRVYRRLEGKRGEVKVECLPNGQTPCNCVGESLSFRGIYSKRCRQKEYTPLTKLKISPVSRPEVQFLFTGAVAGLHSDENGSPVDGRGIFFEDAAEVVLKNLYDYISQRLP